MQIIVSKKCVGGLWTFTRDGGAMNTTFLLNAIVPKNAVVDRFWVKTLISPLSLGPAQIIFGLTEFINNKTLTSLPLYDYKAFVFEQCLQGVNFNDNPVTMDLDRMIVMAVVGADLTAGSIAAVCEYTFMDV